MLPRTKLILACIAAFILFIVVDQMRGSSSQEKEQDEAAQAAISTSDWKQFQSSNNKFSVLLPSLPQHASDTIPMPSGQGTIRYDMYLSQEKDASTYMVSLVQYPDSYDMTAGGDMPDGIMKEMMAGNPNNKLKMVEKSLFLNSQALDFTIENNDVTIRAKAFVTGKTLIVLTVIDRNSTAIEAKFEKFANSFTWNEQTQLPVAQ